MGPATTQTGEGVKMVTYDVREFREPPLTIEEIEKMRENGTIDVVKQMEERAILGAVQRHNTFKIKDGGILGIQNSTIYRKKGR